MNSSKTTFDLPKSVKPGSIRFCRLDGGPIQVSKIAISGWSVPLVEGTDYRYPYTNYPPHVHATENIYRPETIQLLQKARINMIWVTWSAGFSPEAEKPQQEILVPFIHQCQKKGIRVLAYLSLANIFWETFFEEHPESQEWIQQEDDNGSPYHYFGQPGRFMCCLNHPGFLRLQKLRIHQALTEGNADGLFYDNNFHVCRCRRCRNDFAKYSCREIGKTMVPPTPRDMKLAGDYFMAQKMASIQGQVATGETDELLAAQLWEQYRKIVIGRTLETMARYARTLKKDVIVSANNDMRSEQAIACNIISSEDGEDAGMYKGQIISPAYHIKYYLAEGNYVKPVMLECAQRLNIYTRDNKRLPSPHFENRFRPTPAKNLMRTMATCHAYGGSYEQFIEGQFLHDLFFHKSEGVEAWDAVAKMNTFFHANENLYAGSRAISPVAVVIDHGHKRGLLNYLLLNGIHYDAIMTRHLNIGCLDKYQVVLLPDVKYLTPRQCATIKDYVYQGGTLLSTFETSLKKSPFQSGSDFALCKVFGISYFNRGKDLFFRHEYGKGVSYYYPQSMLADGMGPWWSRPVICRDTSPKLNWRVAGDILRKLRKTNDTLPVIVDAAYEVLWHIRQVGEKLVLHLINHSDKPRKRVRLILRNTNYHNGNIVEVSIGTPGKAIRTGKRIIMTHLNIYKVIVFEKRRAPACEHK